MRAPFLLGVRVWGYKLNVVTAVYDYKRFLFSWKNIYSYCRFVHCFCVVKLRQGYINPSFTSYIFDESVGGVQKKIIHLHRGFYIFLCLHLATYSVNPSSMSVDFWNQRYAEQPFAYGEQPNHFFATQISALSVGSLLLPAEGEGRNAVFAATIGWQVTAFDQSEAGCQKCKQLAAQHAVTVNVQVADAAAFDYGENRYDAIALIFTHFPSALRQQVHRQVVKALKPGGILLLEAFTPAQLHYSSGGPKELPMLYTAAMLHQEFHALSIQYCEEINTTLDEGPYHQGTAAVVRLIAQKPM